MKLAALALLLFAAAPPRPEPRYLRYERAVQTQKAAQSCAPLDAQVFEKASPGLADVRLYTGEREVPYAVRTAEVPASASRLILPLNAGVRGGRTEFDAAMPAVTYTDVELQITGQNFQAKVDVSGSQTPVGSSTRHVGTYTIFDLTREKSGRNTVLHLPVSDYRYLHFAIDGHIAPDAVTGITVMAAPIGPEPAYTTVAQSNMAIQSGRATTLTFTVPAHVPVDRVLFQPGGSPVQFVRSVNVMVTSAARGQDDEQLFQPTNFTGTLTRLQDTRDGQVFHQENDAVSTSGWAFGGAQTWTVVVDNGDDQPLQLGAVRLQMLQRELCFGAAGAGAYLLRYGDPALEEPRYDYVLQASGQSGAAAATLGPERANPAWVPRPDDRAFTERHPLLLWIALIVIVVLLGAVALRSRPRRE